MKITSHDLGNKIKKFILKKDNNFEVHILNLGAVIQKIVYNGQNMVLSYSDYNCYYNNSSYMGALIGRTSGRIENAKFNLNNKEYKLDSNNGTNNLHGGLNGLNNKIFDYEILDDKLVLSYYDQNPLFPAKVLVKAIYSLSNETNALNVEYIAKSDDDTYINLTNHSYFNLSGINTTILNHKLTINADYYWELKDNMIPKTKKKVDNTIFDFRKGKLIGENLGEKNSQFDITYYYDHPFELNKKKDYDIMLEDSETGISMKIKTNQKYVVMYAGNFLHLVKNVDGLNENPRHLGVALEPQNLPNGINIDDKYYEITTKDNEYYESIVYTFEGGQS
ncbi:aldose epimerase family protein [Oceanivirga salmonicida]|uniref:aldose epimerase family protein n=1 Tax=Oceanivirga salmonicida TaxID=1769291 RepID=UPI00082CBB7C|nr:aldose epimerase family protein [Oceanivirga salmonicida]